MGLDADLAAVFRAGPLTVPVVYGTQQARGVLTIDDDVEPGASPGAMLVTRRVVLTIAAGALANLQPDMPITVDGRPYLIRTVLAHDLGRLVDLVLTGAM